MCPIWPLDEHMGQIPPKRPCILALIFMQDVITAVKSLTKPKRPYSVKVTRVIKTNDPDWADWTVPCQFSLSAQIPSMCNKKALTVCLFHGFKVIVIVGFLWRSQ